MPRRSLTRLYRDEFSGYSLAKFQQDLLAGLTVAAVALPLALAFGVASGASAAAGLVTAILAGLIMGLLAGAPYHPGRGWSRGGVFARVGQEDCDGRCSGGSSAADWRC